MHTQLDAFSFCTAPWSVDIFLLVLYLEGEDDRGEYCFDKGGEEQSVLSVSCCFGEATISTMGGGLLLAVLVAFEMGGSTMGRALP